MLRELRTPQGPPEGPLKAAPRAAKVCDIPGTGHHAYAKKRRKMPFEYAFPRLVLTVSENQNVSHTGMWVYILLHFECQVFLFFSPLKTVCPKMTGTVVVKSSCKTTHYCGENSLRVILIGEHFFLNCLFFVRAFFQSSIFS